MKWRVVCDKDDASGTLYDEKWKADRAARNHKLNNASHSVKVQRIEAVLKVKEEYKI
jgi:hypothetical protein